MQLAALFAEERNRMADFGSEEGLRKKRIGEENIEKGR